MPDSFRVEDYEARIQPEVDELWKRWRAGALAHHARLLKNFAARQRGRIVSLTEGLDDSRGVGCAVKQLVIEAGTVHTPTEMRDQMREIHNDIWYHGERGEHDAELIAANWTARHAANWRRWRIKEYLFVVDRIEEELAALIR